jgi:hypothetical protein
MRYFSLALVLAVQVVSLSSQSAEAEGFKIRKDSLEQVDWFHGKRQVQIVDDDIEVHDLRRRRAPAPYVDINLAPVTYGVGDFPSGPAGLSSDSSLPTGGLRVGRPGTTAPPTWQTTLPQSGFGQSNIPSRRLPISNLQPGYSTGIHGQLMKPAKTDTLFPPTRIANRGDYIKPPVKTYAKYNASGDGMSQYNYRADVFGQIKPRGHLLAR